MRKHNSPWDRKQRQYKEQSKQGAGSVGGKILNWWVAFLLLIFSIMQLTEWSPTTVVGRKIYFINWKIKILIRMRNHQLFLTKLLMNLLRFIASTYIWLKYLSFFPLWQSAYSKIFIYQPTVTLRSNLRDGQSKNVAQRIIFCAISYIWWAKGGRIQSHL